jgi:hypothetical protein
MLKAEGFGFCTVRGLEFFTLHFGISEWHKQR